MKFVLYCLRFATVTLVTAFASMALAHHTWVVEYERDEVIVLEATISKLQIISPHSRIYLDVEGDEAVAGTWLGETWPLAQLYRRGMTKETFAVGDKVIVTGERATRGRKGLHMRTIYRPSDGLRIWIGLGPDTGENTADGIGDGINIELIEDESNRPPPSQ